MKKNDWILIITVALYSFLFYKQVAGINFVIFNITLIASLGIKDKSLFKNNKWRIAAIGSLLTSFCIAYYGNTLSVIGNIISLSLLSSVSYNSKTSVITSLLFAFYSYFSSPVFMLLDWQERKMRNVSNQSGALLKRTILIIIPLLITLLFFFMYRESNTLFYDFTKNINLNIISWSWVMFTISGLILLYGFFYFNKIKFIANLDENASNNLDPSMTGTLTLLGKKLSINDEEFSGTILFILLNSLLLIVNALDINFLFIERKLPQGVSYSQFVHQGTGILITSILIAIAIILFYFRGALNFFNKNKTIKILTYIWIFQNAFMLTSTLIRNGMYIAEYSLTYKRIGVYVYLILALAGLLTVLIKIIKAKSNIYLFRINGWIFYGALIASCFVNWDVEITKFNVHNAKSLDKNYLLGLSNSNLPQLFTLEGKKEESTLKEEDKYIKETYNSVTIEEQLSKKLYYFMVHRENSSWKSWNYDNTRIYNQLMHLNYDQRIKKLKLRELEIFSLESLKEFNNLNEMQLNSNYIEDIKEILPFTSLRKLDLSGNKLVRIDGIDALKQLEYLNLSQNQITNYFPLHTLKNLKEVRVQMDITQFQYVALQKNLPNTKIIKY